MQEHWISHFTSRLHQKFPIFYKKKKTKEKTVKTTWLYNRVTDLGLRETTVVAFSTRLVGVVGLMLLEVAACATGMLTVAHDL